MEKLPKIGSVSVPMRYGSAITGRTAEMTSSGVRGEF